MTIDPYIRDQAYQFFIEEASELLNVIETGLLNLRQDISVQKVHEIMRAAHSIKGGAASVELETIKIIAHRLEDAFKALYSDTVVLDEDLETLLLRAYDCLRHPLQAQIDTGQFNEKQALAAFESIFGELDVRLGPAMKATDGFMPSAADLGVDIVASIFEIDVADVLSELRQIASTPPNSSCGQELQTQLEILSGFAELVELPGFTNIITTAQIAADRHYEQPLPVVAQVINDVEQARTAILTGDKSSIRQVSDTLLALAEGAVGNLGEPTANDVPGYRDDLDLSDLNLDALQQSIHYEIADSTIISSENASAQVSNLEEIWSIEADEFPSVEKLEENIKSDVTSSNLAALEDVWGHTASTSPKLADEISDVDANLDEALSKILESQADLEPDIRASENYEDSAELKQAIESEVSTPKVHLNNIESAVNLVSQSYDSLPKLPKLPEQQQISPKKKKSSPISRTTSRLSAKVALERLERMNNLVGELAINRNSLSLQNTQFQATVRRLGQKFSSFHKIVKQLQRVSDQILVSPQKQLSEKIADHNTIFDSLEMDSYSEVNSLLEAVLEEVFQLAESIDDVDLFAGQSNRLLKHQQRTLTQLRDELMWSRMVPLDRILKRFPRVLRDLSNTYQKPVQLKLTGTDVLVDRVMLEKLYDPLLHLLRNAFDHGIEDLAQRQAMGKPEQGTIEIRAYHQGNYTVIDVNDDGQGLDVSKIAQRAIEAQLLLPEQIVDMSKQQIQELIFEPGFSTASEVTELSGRGVGLDVVRENLQAFNGKLSLTTHQNKGTLFSLKVPLTLTLTKLVVGSVDNVAIAINSDNIEEILKPAHNQLKQSGGQHFLHWREQLVPVYKVAELLGYQWQLPTQLPLELQLNKIARNTQKTMLVIQQGQKLLALELDRVVTEQELVIKPMGKAIAAPNYINGCTILADGSLVPVIDGAALVKFEVGASKSIKTYPQHGHPPTLMIIDDSSALRRTLALTLRKVGYQVLQAKDGRDALEQLQQGALPDLIICDVEMPRLNGFEFLNQRRENPVWVNIPTVMLTSRGNHKHRTLAKRLGATDYFTKPYIEKEFTDAIAVLLEQQHS
ncbi:MAG: response regulator [Cyanobacteria bacterium P01_H01_bin.21]